MHSLCTWSSLFVVLFNFHLNNLLLRILSLGTQFRTLLWSQRCFHDMDVHILLRCGDWLAMHHEKIQSRICLNLKAPRFWWSDRSFLELNGEFKTMSWNSFSAWPKSQQLPRLIVFNYSSLLFPEQIYKSICLTTFPFESSTCRKQAALLIFHQFFECTNHHVVHLRDFEPSWNQMPVAKAYSCSLTPCKI